MTSREALAEIPKIKIRSLQTGYVLVTKYMRSDWNSGGAPPREKEAVWALFLGAPAKYAFLTGKVTWKFNK